MKKKVIMEIVGSQRIDSQSDKIEMTTVGTLDESEDEYIFRYTEEPEPPMKPVHATVRLAKDGSRVEITRSGDVGSCLVIERSKRNLCRYGTQYGDVLMGIFGNSIEMQIEGAEGSCHFGYDIDINGTLTSRNELDMKFRENGAG